MKEPLLHFNRGRVDPLALARVDQKRVAISADTMTNFIPRVLGPMSLRPGWKYLDNSKSNLQAKYIPFIFSSTDTALIECTPTVMRVFVNDALISRPAVTTAVTNGSFTANIVGWTDNSDAGGAIAWDNGALKITGNGTAFGIADQQVTTVETGTEHALRISVTRGPVICRIGSTSGGDEYITETTLGTGWHSLSFTPTGDFHIRFQSSLKRLIYVDSCTVESSGDVELATPWTATELSLLRWDQSGDVLFVACEGFQQRRIERRSTRSWSIVLYQPEDGPFRTENTGPITLTPTNISGNTTLTASKALFKSTNVGSLYRVDSTGQLVTKNATQLNDATDPVKISGITSDRIFTIQLVGNTWAGSTVTLQRSLNDPDDGATWAAVVGKTWTSDTTETFDDGLDNQEVWYRVIVTNYVGVDDIDMTLLVNSGTIPGVCRVTGYTSETVVSVEVIEDFGNTTATDVWSESVWSDRRGWPSSVAFHEGRLWWAGKDKIIGSISDAYDSFDPDFEGDAGPINRSIGSGPVDTINWALSLQRLLLGGDGAEHSVRSSSFDEPITPTDFMLRQASSQGSGSVPGVKVDQRGVYVDKSGNRVYELMFGNDIDYDSNDLTIFVPEMGSPGLVRLAVARKPDTRLHLLRSDGTGMLGVYDKAEDVLAWVDIETDGQIEDVVILPGTEEDIVYYSVRRVINGATVRCLERWAKETDCRGGTNNYLADSYYQYSGVSTTSITGLSHLIKEQVVVWADGADVGTNDDYTQIYTVSNAGTITLATAASNVIVGLPYTGQFKSAKLGSQNSILMALNIHKNIKQLGLTLGWVHPKGLRFGPDFTNLDDMPEIEEGTAIDQDTIRETYTEHEVIFPGGWESDARLCLQAQAPRPVTVMAAVPNMSVGG